MLANLLDCDNLFGFIVKSLVYGAKAARAKLFEEGVLAGWIVAGNRARIAQARDLLGLGRRRRPVLWSVVRIGRSPHAGAKKSIVIAAGH